jgi:competence protein ComEA
MLSESPFKIMCLRKLLQGVSRVFLSLILSTDSIQLLVGCTIKGGRGQILCDIIVATSKATTPSNSININTANVDELSKLKGIGKAKAAAIIEWRETNGKFSSLEDVDEVRGIGPALLEKNKAPDSF